MRDRGVFEYLTQGEGYEIYDKGKGSIKILSTQVGGASL